MPTTVSERTRDVMVPHHARGAMLARHRLAADLTGVPAAVASDAITIVSELVGNAVRHARALSAGMIRVAWRVDPDVVMIEVTDGGSAHRPRVCSVGPEATSGRGLAIVAALADRWGVELDDHEQSVWAELDLDRFSHASFVS